MGADHVFEQSIPFLWDGISGMARALCSPHSISTIAAVAVVAASVELRGQWLISNHFLSRPWFLYSAKTRFEHACTSCLGLQVPVAYISCMNSLCRPPKRSSSSYNPIVGDYPINILDNRIWIVHFLRLYHARLLRFRKAPLSAELPHR